MAYFQYFPSVTVDLSTQTDQVKIVDTILDLTTNVSLRVSDADKDVMCLRYAIQNGEMPETIALKFYKNLNLGWLVCYIANIGDLSQDWPLSDSAISKYVVEKYGADKLDFPHHYEKLPEGITMDKNFIIDSYGVDKLNIVSNMDYELNINEQKRYIYILKPEYVSAFVTQYMNQLKG